MTEGRRSHSIAELASLMTLAVIGTWALALGIATESTAFIAFGIGEWAAIVGSWGRRRWAYLLAAVFAVIQIALAGFTLVFGLALALSESHDLSGGFLGIGFTVLNGWASLAVLAAILTGSLAILVVARHGLRRARS